MVSKLYSADIMADARPVEIGVPVKPKKVRAKKTKVAPESPVESVEEKLDDVPMKREKKPRTDAQIVALEKMRMARQAKKDAAIKEKEEIERAAKEKADNIEAKKAALKEKRRLAREAKKGSQSPPTTVETPLDTSPKQKVSRKRKAETVDASAPKWLPEIINAIKSETHTDKPKKQLKRESRKEANEKWNDPLAQARITSAADKAQNKMFSAIFPGRRI